MNRPGVIARVFIWLSGASEEGLRDCPAWERRKYVAFGATVLVPCLFAILASAYAVRTLTDNLYIVGAVAAVWSFIILTIDRALLATYRTYQSHSRKIGQFSLRLFVAALMGLTIAHPLTLLLFRDTIVSVIEKDREAEVAAVQAEAEAEKKAVEEKIAGLNEKIAGLQDKWAATFTAGFRVDEGEAPMPEDPAVKEVLEKSISSSQSRTRDKMAEADKEIASLTEQSAKLQTEVDHWQEEFERELNGQRSGFAGLGPRAKSIQDDQLIPRRAEAKRLADLLAAKTRERKALEAETAGIEKQVRDEYASQVAAQAKRNQEERERLDLINRQVQSQQVGQFVEHQNQSRGTFKRQVDAALEEVQRSQADLEKIGEDERLRVAALRAEPRRDLLRQTLALHHLFQDKERGGRFARMTYVVLCLLFLLVDTIPLVLKFFSKPGPYDTLVDCDEVQYDRDRDAFLKNPLHPVENRKGRTDNPRSWARGT